MKNLFNVIKIELRKSLLSKKFLMGLTLLSVLSILSALYMIESRGGYNPNDVLSSMNAGKYVSNPDLPLFTFYNSWVGGDDLSLASTLFYTLLPFGATLPFGWSFCLERNSGYLKNIYSRIDKWIYLSGKTIAVFFSGSLVAFISLVTNILLVLAKIPLVTPFAGYNFYNYIYFGNLWSDLYFATPGIYVLLYVLLDTIYGGLFALLGFSIGFYLRNIIAVTLSPFLLMIAAGYFESILQSGSTDHVPVEFVPTLFLHSQSLHSQTMAWSVILVTIAILAFSLFTIFARGTKDEIM